MSKNVQFSKRKNGEGSVYQIKDGRFGAAVSLGKDTNGKRIRHTETGKTEQAVIEKMQRWLAANGYLEEKAVVINSQSTVAELAEEFKTKGILGTGISDVTCANYFHMLKHFTDYFANKRIGEIDTDEINRFFAHMVNMTEQGKYKYSQTSLNRTVYVTNRMFKRAVRKGYLTVNPLENSDFKKPKSKKVTDEITALEKDEIEELLKLLKGNSVIFPVIFFMLNTGVRTQEALALQWGDINFDTDEIYIQRALTKSMEWDSQGNKIKSISQAGPTKSKAGTRKIRVPHSLIEFLTMWRTQAPKVSKTKVANDIDFVFGNSKETCWSCDGFRKSVNSYLKKSGTEIDSLRLHRIRHTVATMLSNEPDATVFHVMQLLGHSDTRMAQKYIDRQTEQRLSKNQEILGHIAEGLDF